MGKNQGRKKKEEGDENQEGIKTTQHPAFKTNLIILGLPFPYSKLTKYKRLDIW